MIPLIPVAIITGLLTVFAVGAVAVLAYKLTMKVIKKFKIRKASKLVLMKMKKLIEQAPTIKLDDLDCEEDDDILVEYDSETDELVEHEGGQVTIAKETEDDVNKILDDNGGIVIFD